MSTIEFDVHGNLKPYEIIRLSITEFEQEFVKDFSDSDQIFLFLSNERVRADSGRY